MNHLKGSCGWKRLLRLQRKYQKEFLVSGTSLSTVQESLAFCGASCIYLHKAESHLPALQALLQHKARLCFPPPPHSQLRQKLAGGKTICTRDGGAQI